MRREPNQTPRKASPFAVVWGTAGIIGAVFSSVSMANLLQQAFQIGWRKPFAAIMSFYERCLETLFGWADEPIRAMLGEVSAALGIHVEAYPHWKHVFVLMVAYFGLQVRINSQGAKYANVWMTLVLGPVLAVAGSVGYGTAPLATVDFLPTAFLAPIFALTLYGVVASFITALFHPPVNAAWQSVAFYYLRTEVLATVASGAAAFFIGLWAGNEELSNPTLLALGAFISFLALYLLARGVYLGFADRRSESWGQRFRRSASARFGIAFLAMMGGAALFLLSNAGLP